MRTRLNFPLQVAPVVPLVLQFILLGKAQKRDLQGDSDLKCGGVADIVTSSKPLGPTVEPGSGSLSFHCSRISTAPLNKGWGIWEGVIRHLLARHF